MGKPGSRDLGIGDNLLILRAFLLTKSNGIACSFHRLINVTISCSAAISPTHVRVWKPTRASKARNQATADHGFQGGHPETFLILSRKEDLVTPEIVSYFVLWHIVNRYPWDGWKIRFHFFHDLMGNRFNFSWHIADRKLGINA